MLETDTEKVEWFLKLTHGWSYHMSLSGVFVPWSWFFSSSFQLIPLQCACFGGSYCWLSLSPCWINQALLKQTVNLAYLWQLFFPICFYSLSFYGCFVLVTAVTCFSCPPLTLPNWLIPRDAVWWCDLVLFYKCARDIISIKFMNIPAFPHVADVTQL